MSKSTIDAAIVITDAALAAGSVIPTVNRTRSEEGATETLKDVLLEYRSDRANRGRCIIINNHHFNERLTRQLARDGTEVDAANVESCFVALGFDVVRYDDLSVTDMSITLREIAEEDHTDSDCFACVLLSHGDDGVIYGTDGTLRLEQVIARFKPDVCTTLAGKPKLFFIQACRGRKYDFGADLDEPDTASAETVRRIPVEADFLLAYSVVPGHFSWRNNVDGSWFIQALVRVMKEQGDRLELMHLMTLVNRLVAFDFESCTDDDFTTGMKQVPCIVSTLTKLVYFRPKY